MFGFVAPFLTAELVWYEPDIHPEMVDAIPVRAAVLIKSRRDVAFIKYLQKQDPRHKTQDGGKK